MVIVSFLLTSNLDICVKLVEYSWIWSIIMNILWHTLMIWVARIAMLPQSWSVASPCAGWSWSTCSWLNEHVCVLHVFLLVNSGLLLLFFQQLLLPQQRCHTGWPWYGEEALGPMQVDLGMALFPGLPHRKYLSPPQGFHWNMIDIDVEICLLDFTWNSGC